MASFEVVAAELVSAGLPVLFLDTCILLDIIRKSTNRFSRGHAAAASELLRLAIQSRSGCSLVVSSRIAAEWDENVQSVIGEANGYLIETELRSTQFHEACEDLGIGLGVERVRYVGSGLTERLRDLAEGLLRNARCLELSPEINVKALERVFAKVPPARRGGSQLMDCIILEDYLAICREMRRAGSESKLVFCSSNTKDYCDPGTNLHPALAPEFDEVDLTFRSNLIGAVMDMTRS